MTAGETKVARGGQEVDDAAAKIVAGNPGRMTTKRIRQVAAVLRARDAAAYMRGLQKAREIVVLYEHEEYTGPLESLDAEIARMVPR